MSQGFGERQRGQEGKGVERKKREGKVEIRRGNERGKRKNENQIGKRKREREREREREGVNLREE